MYITYTCYIVVWLQVPHSLNGLLLSTDVAADQPLDSGSSHVQGGCRGGVSLLHVYNCLNPQFTSQTMKDVVSNPDPPSTFQEERGDLNSGKVTNKIVTSPKVSSLVDLPRLHTSKDEYS